MTIDVLNPLAAHRVTTTGPYVIDFDYSSGQELNVVVVKDGIEMPVAPAHYTLSPPIDASGGSITLSAGVLSQYLNGLMYVRRATSAQQGWLGTNARERGLERQLDRNVMVLQDLVRAVGRAPSMPAGYQGRRPLLPSPELGRVLVGTANGWTNGVTLTEVANAEANALTAQHARQLAEAAAATATTQKAAAEAARNTATERAAAAFQSATNALESEVGARSSEIAASGSASIAASSAATAQDTLSQYRNFGVDAETLDPGSLATAEYDPETGTVTIGIPTGADGERGVPFTVDASGVLAALYEYNSEPDGFSYLATDTGDLYIRSGGSWSPPIPFVGPDGKSAYDVAVEAGFVGTVQEWLDSLAASARAVYQTRAIAEAAQISPEVGMIEVDTVRYFSDAAGTALVTAGGRRWSPRPVHGEYTPQMWGAVADGSTDAQPAIQAAVDWLCANTPEWTLRFMPGDYRLSDEVDLSAATMDHCLLGEHRTVRIFPDAFGASKACFRLCKNRPVKIWGFTFGNGSGNKDHPIGIYAEEAGRMNFGDITGSGLGNTVIFTTRPFNADWMGPLDLFFCGWQPMHKEITTGSTGTTLRSAENIVTSRVGDTDAYDYNIFDEDDVGQDILIYHDPNENEAGVYRIVEFVNTACVRLDRPVRRGFSNARWSFSAITAACAGDSVIFSRDIGLNAKDVGRMIYIDDAGRNGETHVTQILSVTSGGICRLKTPVVSGGTHRIFFTPTVYIGGHNVDGTGPNDIYIDRLLIEGFRGPGLLVDGGLHIKIGELKLHGRAWGEFSNFGYTQEALIWNGAHKSFIDRLELEFCGKSRYGGVIKVRGSAPGLSMGYMSHNAPCVNGPLFDANFVDTERSAFVLPEINGRTNLDRFDEILSTPTPAIRRRCFASGRIGGISSAVEASAQLPQIIGSARSVVPRFLENGEMMTFRPATTSGFVSVTASDAGGFWGIFKFNDVSCVLAQGASAANALGVSNSLNVTFTGGLLRIQNNSGAGRRFFVSVQG